jgi:preprotein translocase subunit SecB
MMSGMSTPPTASELEELGLAVSARVQIRGVLLINSRVRRGSDSRFSDAALTVELKHNVRHVERIDDGFSTTISFELATHGDTEVEDEPALLIQADFVLSYSVPSLDGLDQNNLVAFAAINGAYNAWPYWREYVQSMSLRMGLPPIVLPVFRTPAGIPSEPVVPESPAAQKRVRRISTQL